MTYTNTVFRLILLTLLAQIVLIHPVPAAETPPQHKLLLFYSANVLGELEPCGG
jgi:hypothetical protein